MIQLFALYESNSYVELSLSKLSEKGYQQIYTVPLDPRVKDIKLVDTMHGTDGTSLVDMGLVLAMMFGTIGVSRGFVWKWGPVYWGLLGAAGGFAVGFLFDVIKNWMKRQRAGASKSKSAPIIVIVQCAEERSEVVEQLLWEHKALGVAKTRMQTTKLPPGSTATAGTFSSPWT